VICNRFDREQVDEHDEVPRRLHYDAQMCEIAPTELQAGL
jgi:hypothetical protein